MYGASLLKGVVIGFSIAAPVGPIGVLCIRRSVTHGRRIGLLSGPGAATFFAPPATAAAAADADGPFGAYLSTVFLTLTNPTTILSFVAIFAGVGIGAGSDYAQAFSLVCGVFVGSALWWLFLSGAAAAFRSRLGPASLRAINRVSGVVIFSFGVYALLSLLRA